MTNGVRLRRASKTFSVLLVVANASETVTMKLGRNFCPSLRKAAQIRTLWQGSGPLSSLCKAWLACLYIEQGCLSPYMEYCWRHYDNATVTSTVSIYGDVVLSPYIEMCPYMEMWLECYWAGLSPYMKMCPYMEMWCCLHIWRCTHIRRTADIWCVHIWSTDDITMTMQLWHHQTTAHIWTCGTVSINGDVPIYGELLTSDMSIYGVQLTSLWHRNCDITKTLQYKLQHTNMHKYMDFIREADSVRLPYKSKTMRVLLVVVLVHYV